MCMSFSSSPVWGIWSTETGKKKKAKHVVPVFQHGPVELKGDGIPPHPLAPTPQSALLLCGRESTSVLWIHGVNEQLADFSNGDSGSPLSGDSGSDWLQQQESPGSFCKVYSFTSDRLTLRGKAISISIQKAHFLCCFLYFPPKNCEFSARLGPVRAGKKLWTSSALFSFPPLLLLRLSSISCAELLQSCPTLDPMGHSRQGSSVWGILQARILERVAMPSSRDLPDPGI